MHDLFGEDVLVRQRAHPLESLIKLVHLRIVKYGFFVDLLHVADVLSIEQHLQVERIFFREE